MISLPNPDSLQNLFSPEQLNYIQLLQKQIPGLPFQSLPPQVFLRTHFHEVTLFKGRDIIELRDQDEHRPGDQHLQAAAGQL